MQRSGIGLGVGLLGAWVAWGCAEAQPGTAGTTDGVGDTDFVSSVGPNGLDSPAPSGASRRPIRAEGLAPAAVPESDGDLSRALAEADIVELSGDRLYALSRLRGLAIIDVSNPSAPSLLGEHPMRTGAAEMYVEDGIVYAMVTAATTYRCDDAQTCSWDGVSRVQALDTRNPASIQVLADVEVPGYVADSRRVGDILYLATRNWSFDTTLTSFDLSDPAGLTQLAQLSLTSPDGRGLYAPHMIVTDQRIYMAGIDESSSDDRPASTIQVVDTAGGSLQAGARFDVAGAVSQPWQLDEHEGVLRVATRADGENGRKQPTIETFRVSSSADIEPLGSLALPAQEASASLVTGRFDGTRAFLVTGDMSGLLLTFDLSDPAQPHQLGQLETQGWLEHIELRDNRLFGLGSSLYDVNGMLNLSLFDVENLAEPQRLGRVAFGEGFTGASNVHTQVAKTFSILDDEGLILVPYGGNYFFKPCAGTLGSGVQLIDFTDTTLTRRGVAPQVGFAERALWHRDHLLGVGDNALQAFDITNRDAPVVSGKLDIVRSADSLRAIDNRILRFGTDWSTGRSTLDTTSLERASDATLETELDLSALAAGSCGAESIWTGQIFMQGSFAYLPHRREALEGAGERLTVHVLDMTEHETPRFVREVVFEAAADEMFASILQTDGALLIGRAKGTRQHDVDPRSHTYDVVDLADPSAPVVASRFEVPAELRNQGWQALSANLSCTRDRRCNAELTDGDIVASQHAELLDGSTTQAKYYLDRIDVSDPYAPRLLPPINVPGVVIHFDAASGSIVTRDVQERGTELNTLTLDGDQAVRTSRLELDDTRWIQRMAVSDSRVFYLSVARERALPEQADPAYSYEVTPLLLESIAFDSGVLVPLPAQELRDINRNSFSYYGALYARGERAFEFFGAEATVIDTFDPSAPKRLTRGWQGFGCQSLEIAGDEAYCAAGDAGVEVIDLSSMR